MVDGTWQFNVNNDDKTYFKEVILTFSLHLTDIIEELLLIIYKDRHKRTRFTCEKKTNLIFNNVIKQCWGSGDILVSTDTYRNNKYNTVYNNVIRLKTIIIIRTVDVRI